MTRLVIESPDLQTKTQRLSAFLLSLSGWILWLYVTFPLLTVCGWLMDIGVCSVWMNWSGGYMSLQELMQFYAATAFGLFIFWFFWMKYRIATRPGGTGMSKAPQISVSRSTMCVAYNVDLALLESCDVSRQVDVEFDLQGRITLLKPVGGA